MNYVSLLLIFAILFMGCQENTMPLEELIMWVNTPSNGLVKSNQTKDFELLVQYRPLGSIISLEERGNIITESSYLKKIFELNGLEYFTLKVTSKTNEEILLTSIRNEQEYYDRMNFFLARFQNSIKLKVDQDTFPCQLYYFERNDRTAPLSLNGLMPSKG